MTAMEKFVRTSGQMAQLPGSHAQTLPRRQQAARASIIPVQLEHIAFPPLA